MQVDKKMGTSYNENEKVEDEVETMTTEKSNLRSKIKKSIGFQKELLPLKLAIFLFYGGNYLKTEFTTIL